LVRAVLHAPQLLVMDEATVGLDPVSRQDLLERIRTLCHEGMGVLWATHLVDEVELADRVVILHRGRVQFDGQPAALLSQTGARSIGGAFVELTGVRPAE
jgi:ABC-2 type transport system ATP-binding protein